MTAPIHSSVKPLIKRPGGKSRMLQHLLPLIDQHQHRCYCEPFCGGAAVLLAKKPSEHEVLNDLDGEICNLYRQVKFHCEELIREMQWMIESRRDFDAFKQQPGLTEIQRAARWAFRNFYSYAGDNDSFGVKRLGFSTRSYLLSKVSAFHVRVDRVTIENLSWEYCLSLYDSEQTLFFLDPPYTAGEVRAYAPWSQDDVTKLSDALRKVKGAWVCTLNDSPANRSAFAGFKITSVSTNANMSNARSPGRRFCEIIIRSS